MTHRVNLTFVPIMAARLMLSLKKAVVQPAEPWSLDTMATTSEGRSLGGGASYHTQRTHGKLHETSQKPEVLDEEDVET